MTHIFDFRVHCPNDCPLASAPVYGTGSYDVVKHTSNVNQPIKFDHFKLFEIAFPIIDDQPVLCPLIEMQFVLVFNNKEIIESFCNKATCKTCKDMYLIRILFLIKSLLLFITIKRRCGMNADEKTLHKIQHETEIKSHMSTYSL